MKSISTFIIAFLIVGFFFLALPEKGFSGVNLGCCITEIPGGECLGCGLLEDCAISEGDCPADALFFNGEACLTNGIEECKNLEGTELGCCVITAGNCNDNQLIGACDEGEGIAWFIDTDCSEVPQCAPINNPIPTLSEWGLIAIAVVLGIVGFMVMRRRKLTA